MFESCWAHHSTRLHLAVGETKSRSWRAISRENALSERSESKGLTAHGKPSPENALSERSESKGLTAHGTPSPGRMP